MLPKDIGHFLSWFKENGPQQMDKLARFGETVLQLLQRIADGTGATNRKPRAVNTTSTTAAVRFDLTKNPGHPCVSGWLKNAGDGALQWRIEYGPPGPGQQEGPGLPWMDLDSGDHISFQQTTIYALNVRPHPDESSATYQFYVV